MHNEPSTVILMHGLGRSPWAMRPVARHLQGAGFTVRNLGYPSQRYSVEQLVDKFVAPAFAGLPSGSPVHWVTHSLGGILLRYFANFVLDEADRNRLQRVVMLAPPNQGSEVVDTLKHWPLLPRIMGPAFHQLGTDSAALWRAIAEREQQQPLPWRVGVIAGTRNWEPWFARLLPDGNDGKVSVKSAHWPGATEVISLPVNHTTLMRDPHVLREIEHFLVHGSFSASQTKRI